MPFDFSGKKVLVTGAGRGIGRELSKVLAAAGGDVYALSLTQENLDSLVTEVPSIHAVQVDLADWEATRREVDQLGCLDGVVNNAAVLPPFHDACEVTREHIQDVLNVNLLAAINIIQVVGKKMVESGKGGSIVNVSSIGGVRAINRWLPYNASKAALDMVTKQFSLELGPHKIRVNSVNPSGVSTEIVQELFKTDPMIEKRLVSNIPAGRLATLREAVEPIMYLLSDHSTMVSGTTHLVDGGHMCHIGV